MRRRIRKLLFGSLIMILLMICGCGDTQVHSGSSDHNPDAETVINSEEETAKPVISIFLPSRRADGIYNSDTLTFRELADRMGVTFDIDTVVSNEASARMRVLLSSDAIPDITAGDISILKAYGADGAFLPLDEYITDKYTFLKKYVCDDPEVMSQCVSNDGHLYVIPMLSAMKTAMGYMIRQDWLDELGMDAPVTIDDWYEYLKAVKNSNLNGQGVGNVNPLFLDKTWEEDYNLFSDAWGIELNKNKDFWTVKDGELVYAPMTEECRAYLAQMQKWYREGLIDPEFITREDTCTYHVYNNMAGAGCFWIGYMASFNKDEKVLAKDPNTNWQVVAPPVLYEGQKPMTFDQQATTVGHGWAISGRAENIDKILEILDYVYSDEGSMLFNFGVEGESFHYVDGVPKYLDSVVEQGSTVWVHRNGCQAYIGMRQLPEYERAQAADEDVARQLFYYEKQDMFYPMTPVVVKYGEDQSRYQTLMTPIISYTEDELLKFLTGVRDMGEYDTFIKTISSMGIGEATNIQNNAYRAQIGNIG